MPLCIAPPRVTAPDTPAMHRLAARDGRTLGRMLRRDPGLDTQQPDAWGNTLLHTACASRHATVQVALLLQAGARVNAPGPYGTTPLAAALMSGHIRAARLVAAAGGTCHVTPFYETSERSLLANVFGIDGVTWLHGRAFELEGALEYGVYPRLAEAVRAFARTAADPRVIGSAGWEQAARALDEAPANCWLPARRLRARLDAKTPILLPGGWRGHSVCFAMAAGRIIRANRAKPRRMAHYKTLQAWRFAKGAPPVALLAGLQGARFRGTLRGQGLLAALDMFNAAPKHRGLAQACGKLAPGPQKAHNCVVANAKAGLLALLLLTHRQVASTRLRHEYKRLTTFMRLWFLQTYLARHDAGDQLHPPDFALVGRCEAKLRASTSRRPHLEALRAACRQARAG